MQTRSQSSSTNTSADKAEENSRGVPEDTRKQLAKDIDQAGGIDNFDKTSPQALDELLNNPTRKELYKERGDPLRKKIRGLVREWKKFPKEKYLKKVFIPFVLGKRAAPEPEEEPSSSASNTPSIATPPSSNPEPAAKRVKRSPPAPALSTSQSKAKSSADIKPKPTKMTTNDFSNTPNKMGKLLVIPITEGRIFCALWNDMKLNTELELFFGTDGHSIWTKTKEARFGGGVDFLCQHFPTFGSQKDNVITSTVNQVIKKLDPGKGEPDQWDEEQVISLKNEVIQTLVDQNGDPTEDDPVAKTVDGHQIIMFFLKDKAYHEEQMKNAKCTFAKSTPAGMNVGGSSSNDDDSSMGAETAAEEIRNELKAVIKEVAESQARQQKALQEQLAEQQRQQQQRELETQQSFLDHQRKQQEQMQAQTQQMIQQMMQMAMGQQQQQQPPQQQPPVPDGAQSNGGFQ